MPKTIPDNKMRVNPKRFIKQQDKYTAYILGFMWAEGYFTNNHYAWACTIVKKDFENIEHILDKTGNWYKYDRQRKNRQLSKIFQCYGEELISFLKKYDYQIKSVTSPTKILSFIKPSLHKYFYHGWIDGDGCFYISKNTRIRQFTLNGSYEQDWSSFETLCKSLNITYNIQRLIRKNGNKHSCIRITNSYSIQQLITYIYHKTDIIGLSRKFDKAKQILSVGIIDRRTTKSRKG